MVLDSLPHEVLLYILSSPAFGLKAADLGRLSSSTRVLRKISETAAKILCRHHICCRDVSSSLLEGILSLGLSNQSVEEPYTGSSLVDSARAVSIDRTDSTYELCEFQVAKAVRTERKSQISHGATFRFSWIRMLYHLDCLERAVSQRTGSMAAGSSFSLCVSLSGEVYGFGSCRKFGLGLNSPITVDVPVRISSFPAGISVCQVAAGSDHSLFLSQEGHVFAVGDNGSGSLGLGLENYHTTVIIPQKIESFGGNPLVKIVKIAAGNHMSAAIDDFGKLYTFGGSPLMLGHGDTHEELEPRQVLTFCGKKVFSISVGLSHVLAIAETDETSGHRGVYSWGYSTDGALGLGFTKFKAIPELIPELFGEDIWPVAVSAGRNHSLAVLLGGNLLSWGNFESRAESQATNSESLTRQPTNEKKRRDKKSAMKQPGTRSASCSLHGTDTLKVDEERTAKSREHRLLPKYGEITKQTGPDWGVSVVPSGCLGHNEDLACCRPKLVSQLIGRNVISVAAGWYVSYVVTDLGEVLEFGVTYPACQEILEQEDFHFTDAACERDEEIVNVPAGSSALTLPMGEKYEMVVSSCYDVASHTLLLGRSGKVFSFGYDTRGQRRKLGDLWTRKSDRSVAGRYVLDAQEIERLHLGES